ncbi:MAG: TIGR03936 family radical SAM-associated protein [Candidatus Melainabacteria bacterium]
MPTLTPQTLTAQPVDRALLEDHILQQVMKPARYLGIEEGAYRKPWASATVRMAFAFPDLYEIGISNYGVKLFYSLVNQQKNYLCDRVYAPAPDMKAKLAEHEVPLYGLETLVPLTGFDLLAFTLQYELNYSTILGMLEAAHIPLRAADRNSATPDGGDYPILIAGGPGSGNPMSLAPFFEAFIIGDGEEVLLEILETIETGKARGWPRAETLQALSRLKGVYMPGLTERAEKRIVDIAEHPVDMAPLIPTIQAVHDRVTIEARRGCDRMCRFCQPCFINLPVREQSIENIKSRALSEIAKTGYEECSLLSLSIADYSYFKPLILEVADALKEEGVSLSLPSQRADRFSIDVAEAVQSVRKSTLTFAPEAGTKRLRDVINKNLSDEEILSAVTAAYKTGWNKVKLYFIIGLPTETLDDLDGIVNTVKMLQAACREIKRDASLSIKKHLEVNVTLSNFVPKPHTPFQWFPQDTMAMIRQKVAYLKEQFRGVPGVKLNFTDPEISKLEAVISKAGPELADALELAYRKGAYLDAWDDIQNFSRWFEALAELGFDPEAYTRERACDPDGDLPWDVIDMGLDKAWLVSEYDKAKAEAATVPCFLACSECGVCANYNTWPKFTEEPRNPIAQKVLPAPAADPAQKEKPVRKAGAAISSVAKHQKLPVCKLRLTVEKKDALKFISHLDWLRLIHRAVIKAGLPLAYSQGFNPKPKIAFGPALPLFCEGLSEYVDIELVSPLEGPAADRLNPLLPDGGKVVAEAVLPFPYPSIDKAVRKLYYTARLVSDNSSDHRTCNPEALTCMIKERVDNLIKQSGDSILPEAGPDAILPTRDPLPTDVLQTASVLKTCTVAPDATIRFTLEREANRGQQKATVKPVHVLSLIIPEARWSLVRTGIELTP